MKRTGVAVVGFRNHVFRMIEEEKAEIKAGTQSRWNLVASLVKVALRVTINST
jgi:hypothetical protein